MEFQDVVRKRRMVRNFDQRPVTEETVERILSNALRAPSAGFSQGSAFLLLRTQEERARFWDAEWPVEERSGPYDGMMRAPVLVVPMGTPPGRRGRPRRALVRGAGRRMSRLR